MIARLRCPRQLWRLVWELPALRFSPREYLWPGQFLVLTERIELQPKQQSAATTATATAAAAYAVYAVSKMERGEHPRCCVGFGLCL